MVPMAIRKNQKRPIKHFPTRRGGWSMIPSSAGSPAATKTNVTAQIKGTVKSLNRRQGSFTQTQHQTKQHRHTLLVVDGSVDHEHLSKVIPHNTTFTDGTDDCGKVITAKIILEASRATSVPSLPMATPISVAFKPLTPSLVIPHT